MPTDVPPRRKLPLPSQVPCNSIESCSLYLQDIGGSDGEWKQFMIGDRLVEMRSRKALKNENCIFACFSIPLYFHDPVINSKIFIKRITLRLSEKKRKKIIDY